MMVDGTKLARKKPRVRARFQHHWQRKPYRKGCRELLRVFDNFSLRRFAWPVYSLDKALEAKKPNDNNGSDSESARKSVGVLAAGSTHVGGDICTRPPSIYVVDMRSEWHQVRCAL